MRFRVLVERRAAVAAVLAAAAEVGHLHTAARAADYLALRRADLDHLIRAGYLTPATYGRHGRQRARDAPAVALYRRGDLDALDATPGLDLATVRTTPPGHRSALTALPTADRNRSATGGPSGSTRRKING